MFAGLNRTYRLLRDELDEACDVIAHGNLDIKESSMVADTFAALLAAPAMALHPPSTPSGMDPETHH